VPVDEATNNEPVSKLSSPPMYVLPPKNKVFNTSIDCFDTMPLGFINSNLRSKRSLRCDVGKTNEAVAEFTVNPGSSSK
jgi:hypothetical protein